MTEQFFLTRSKIEYTILNGTLTWDMTGDRDCTQCLDIDPDVLYELENVKEKIA